MGTIPYQVVKTFATGQIKHNIDMLVKKIIFISKIDTTTFTVLKPNNFHSIYEHFEIIF